MPSESKIEKNTFQILNIYFQLIIEVDFENTIMQYNLKFHQR